jgi:hypothetical protein
MSFASKTHSRSPLSDEGLLELQSSGAGKMPLCRRRPMYAPFELD